MNIIGLLLLGFLTGIVSGFLGIGGAVVIIPALVYIFHLSQHCAQGTTLALMIPPIGLLAAWQYWRSGNVNLHIAVWIAIGFFVGGLVGALLVNKVPDILLRKIFGIFLALIALKMIFSK